MLQTNFLREPVDVLPKLANSIQCLTTLKTKTTDFVIDEASHHLEFHTTVITHIDVLQQVCVGSSVQSALGKTHTNKPNRIIRKCGQQKQFTSRCIAVDYDLPRMTHSHA